MNKGNETVVLTASQGARPSSLTSTYLLGHNCGQRVQRILESNFTTLVDFRKVIMTLSK